MKTNCCKSRYHHAYELPMLLKLIDKNVSGETKKALDFGCGYGNISHLLADMGYEVTGLDTSEKAINVAKTRYPAVRFICNDIDNINLLELENNFDLILAIDVIEHLFDPKRFFKVMRQILKPGGTLIVSTPFHGYLKNLAISIFGGWDKHFTVLSEGGHIKFFSANTLRTMIKAEGYKNIKFYHVGRMPLLWKAMICSCNR